VVRVEEIESSRPWVLPGSHPEWGSTGPVVLIGALPLAELDACIGTESSGEACRCAKIKWEDIEFALSLIEVGPVVRSELMFLTTRSACLLEPAMSAFVFSLSDCAPD
jgi:hypothetical protein